MEPLIKPKKIKSWQKLVQQYMKTHKERKPQHESIEELK